MADKVFVDGIFIKERTFSSGGSIIGVAIKAEDFQQFLQNNVNDKGFVNIDIKRNLAGDKMYAELNSYQAPEQTSTPTPATEEAEEESNDLPF